MTFQGWYASPANHDFVNLQIIEEAAGDYNPCSKNDLTNQKIETFDFAKLVSEFDQARAANPRLSLWNLMNGLLDAHQGRKNTCSSKRIFMPIRVGKITTTGCGIAAAQVGIQQSIHEVP